MREVADADRIRRFMHALAEAAEATARVYFTGGATAVLIGCGDGVRRWGQALQV